MSKDKPTVQDFMTAHVESIGGNKTLKEANSLMQAKKIRHLPVMMDGLVVGIISDRDIKAALGMTGVDPAKSLVHYFCKHDVYVVSPEMRLDHVAEALAANHYGSAVVMKDGKLVGILTMVDICRALVSVINAL
jgi:acetoin utilization protein AcuB